MPKEITINYGYSKGEFLVRLFEEGKLKDWQIVNRSEDVRKIIADFWFTGIEETD